MVYRVGQDIEEELAYNAPPSIRIMHKQDIAGCCHPAVSWLNCACFCPVLKKRTFNWIGENMILKNNVLWCLCTPSCDFCAPLDISRMQLLSSEQFEPCCSCCGAPCGARGFATEVDMTYACWCISMKPCYDCCCKPCYGEALWITPCENGTCCFKLGTRCCICFTLPFDACLADSETYRSVLLQQVASTRKVNLTPNQLQVVQKVPPTVQAIAR